MDPFEGYWFRTDGTGVHATQPGCNYYERRFTWQSRGERTVRLHFEWEGPDEPDEEDCSVLVQFDFQVRRTAVQVDVELTYTLPELWPIYREMAPIYSGFRFTDARMFYFGGPDETDKPVRWALWGGLNYFG